jgi:putative phosphoesterase
MSKNSPSKIGLISDIHSNLPALESVLEDMPEVDSLVCLGDVVGYGPWPADCVETVRKECDFVLQGNHDREVESPETYWHNEMAKQGLEYARDELSSEQLEWLDELPESRKLFDDRLFAVHSHPEKTDEYVEKSDFTSVATYMNQKNRALALGHTHVQASVDMSKFDRHGFVMNPGSVGQPRDKDPRAAYAVLDLEEPKVELHRVEYPLSEVRNAVYEADLPSKTAKRLEEGW